MDDVYFPSTTDADDYLESPLCPCVHIPAYPFEMLPRVLASISPIPRLPEDVLSEIFALVALDFQSSLALSHVSKRWRWVALGMPGLWTTLTAQLPPTAREVERWKMCTRRAGIVPLSVTITATDAPADPDLIREQLRLSLTPVGRFQTLRLEGDDHPGFPDLILRTFGLPTATLSITDLSLVRVRFETRDAFFPLITSCPSLKRLSITRSFYRVLDVSLRLLTVHLPFLESIEADDMAVVPVFLDPQVGRVSIVAPRLDRLSLQGDWLARPLLNPNFSTVRVLTIRVTGRLCSSVILETLSGFPGLKDLTLAVDLWGNRRDPVVVGTLPRIERIDFRDCKRVERLAGKLMKALKAEGDGSLRVVCCGDGRG